jgi:probable Rubsico expression protein CbbX
MYKEGVQDQLDKLDRELVGLVPVKKRVKEIASLLVLDKMRRKLGFETAVPSLHMSFTGAPGTGKTTVAVRMGSILAKMGYSRRGHVVLATRDDLVGQYVGHTAPKTKEMIKKAMGGVLLVDEAYYLFNAGNDRDYGQESIEILLNVMENQQDDLVVALAGYKDRMDTFFTYIPGMMSRIGNHIDFPDYSADELTQIAAVMAEQLEYDIDESAYKVFKEYIVLRMELPFFSNARTVRNAMDRARMNSAIRVFDKFAIQGENDGVCTVNDLKAITAEDFQVLVDDIVNADASKVIFS